MREIKFRAWDKANKIMYEVGGISFGKGKILDICNENGSIFPEKKENVIEWVLMQYTGIKDKNGKEIYEGDIVHSYLDKDNPVQILKKKFINKAKNAKFWCEIREEGDEYFKKYFDERPLEIQCYVEWDESEHKWGLMERFINDKYEEMESNWSEEVSLSDDYLKVNGNINEQ